jgi:hypothetical protein
MFKAPAPQKQTQKADARQNMPNYHFYFFLVPEEIITEGLKKKKKKSWMQQGIHQELTYWGGALKNPFSA